MWLALGRFDSSGAGLWRLASIAMAELVSVLTAGYRLNPVHLRDAYESLITQKAVEWEWVIQIDARSRKLPDWLLDDSRVHIDVNKGHYGIAITRNRALMRCRGEHVQNLDDDDQLASHALADLSTALDRHPVCAFAFGDGWNGDAEGAPQLRWTAPCGVLDVGELFDRWVTHTWRTGSPPLAPGGVMWRRSILLAQGGWRAMTGSEDTALVMSAAERHPCIGIGKPTIIVREHKGRISRTAELRAAKADHWEFIRQQVLAIRAMA